MLPLSRERVGAFDSILSVASLYMLTKAVDSVYGIMCDPRIKVAGAPLFGANSIYGIPIWFLSLLALGFVFIVIDRTSPRVSRLLARYRLAVFIGFIVLAVVLPTFPFPHRVLGACSS